jgi:cell fate regulator YaaT (PSP1 superfamily)
MSKIVSIQFRPGGKIFDFEVGHFVLSRGDKIMVNTDQGLELGTVVAGPFRWEHEGPPKNLKKVHRLATPEDLKQFEKNLEREKEGQEMALERIRHHRLPMNLVQVESFFDGSKMIFYFTADNRVDFRDLVKDLVARFRTRIEMRQIGVRNEAKMLGGLGGCGRELCCASFLSDFTAVSVKMAKEQNLPLNPTKISGICGRLMCCLTYEYDTYLKLKQDFPRVGKRVRTPKGVGKVIRQNVIGGRVAVELEDGKEDDFKLSEVVLVSESEGNRRD